MESALLINKEAACQDVCRLAFLSVSAAHITTRVATYLPVKMYHAFLDFISSCLRHSVYAISVFPWFYLFILTVIRRDA